ncbi:acyltransferase family protein, partial [Acinetobacter baumannii]
MTRRSFATLDGLRGVAALLVVYHHEHLAGIVGAPAGAYLAVDLFFLMSGFVIAHAYEARLEQGLSAL